MNLKIAFSDRFRKTYRNLKKNEQELVDKGYYAENEVSIAIP